MNGDDLEGSGSLAENPCIGVSFPPEERFRLADQICRSAISVPANIVEGQSRQTTKEYLQFLHHARGSVEETRYHLLLARDLGYMGSDGYMELGAEYEQVSRMLNTLIQSLRKRTGSGRSP